MKRKKQPSERLETPRLERKQPSWQSVALWVAGGIISPWLTAFSLWLLELVKSWPW